jgi:hypothetical protein
LPPVTPPDASYVRSLPRSNAWAGTGRWARMDDGSSDSVFQGQYPGQTANRDGTYALIRRCSNALFRQGRPRVQGLTIESYRTGAHELDALRCEVLFKPDGQTLPTPDHPSVGVDINVFLACDELPALRSARRCPLGWKNGGAHLVGVERAHDDRRSGLPRCRDDGRLEAAERPVARNDPDRRHREGTNNHRPPPAGGDRLGRWDALVWGRLDRRAVHAVIRRMPLHVRGLGDLAGRRFR